MLEESLKQNIIVAMDTGSGKTHIAVLRVQAELERCLSNQLIWFMAPTVALCHQQYEVFCTHLPQYQARLLSGEDNVDRWSNQAIWDAVLANMQIIVSTHKVLEDALTHGFVQMAKLALLVYDEAHHCTGRHPANKILQDFYHPRLAKGDTVPHILGLTASPVVNARPGSLEAIERNLNAVTRTPKMQRSEMLQYVHQPLLVKVAYSTVCEMEQPPGLQALRHAYAGLDIMRDPYVVNLLRSQEPDALKLDKALLNRKTYCQVQMKTLLAKAEEIYKELGTWSVEWYIKTCISNFMDAVQKDDLTSSEATLEEKQYLCSTFERMNAMTAESQPLPSGNLPSASPKAHALIDILANAADPAFTGLVFVQQRVTVAALQQLLTNHPATSQAYKVSTFIGTSAYSSRQSSIAEYVEPRNQKGVLEEFRSGQTNLIITTSVLEEGIDASACHVVICFEEPKNLKEFIQRRGRARKKQSKYVILVEDDCRSTATAKWQNLEQQMKETYMNDMREVQAIQQRESAADEEPRAFRIERTGALLTLDNAVPHLHHFCATLSASPYVDLRPEFSVSEDPVTELVSAVVILPTAVDPLLRRCNSLRQWTTERQAKKDAAFQACITLHEAGLINDHLMPLLSKKEEEFPEDEVVEERPAVIAVSERSNPWVTAALRFTDQILLRASFIQEFPQAAGGVWFESVVTLETEGRTVASMIMLLAIQPPNLPTFMLYWNEDISYQVTVKTSAQSRTLCLGDDELTKVGEVTHFLLKSVYGVRVAEGRFDFPALILPREYSGDLQSWLHKMGRKRESGQYVGNGLLKEDIGLVRVKGREAAGYLFEGFEMLDCSLPDSAGTTPKRYLRVKKLPKRRDFLHPTISEYASQKAAYTATDLFPAEDCMIDSLPASYSLFGLFLPSILHRMECFLLAEELRTTVLAPVGINDICLVLEAISTSSARESTDYQRLEFLGDCILGLCTAVHLMARHPSWPEGYLTRSKGNSNSNSYLARAALRLGLDRFIINTAFTGAKWKPTYISELQALSEQKREMSTKTLADVVEALIGASYVDGGMKKVNKCLQLLLPDLLWIPLEEGQVLLFNGAPATAFHTVHMDNLQRLVGYTFKKPALLQEAVTHASYNADATSLSYQRLEFLGDAVLDYLVVQRLFAREPAYKEHQMHTMRTALVNADFLAFLCMEWNIEQERAQVVEDKETGTFSTIEVPVKQSLWQFMRHNNAEIAKAQQAAILRHNELREEINEMLERGDHYPWALFARTEAEKFFSDLVESLIGAVYVDSRADMQACENVLEKLGVLKYARRIMGGGQAIHLLHPKEELGRLADRDKVKYETKRSKEGWTCVVMVGSETTVEVDKGTSRIEAETRAATLAVHLLKSRIGRTSSKRNAEEEIGTETEKKRSFVEDRLVEAMETQ